MDNIDCIKLHQEQKAVSKQLVSKKLFPKSANPSLLSIICMALTIKHDPEHPVSPFLPVWDTCKKKRACFVP